MTYTATITSQGQITIPIKLRRRYFPEGSRVVIEERPYGHQTQVVIKPIMELKDVVGVATRYQPLPKKFDLEKTIKNEQKQAANKAAAADSRILKNLKGLSNN